METVYQAKDETVLSVQSAPFGPYDATVFTRQQPETVEQAFFNIASGGVKQQKKMFPEMNAGAALFVAQSNVDEAEFVVVYEHGELSYVDEMGNSLFSHNEFKRRTFRPVFCQFSLLPDDDEGLLLMSRDKIYLFRISNYEDDKQLVSTEVSVDVQRDATLACASLNQSTVAVIWSNGIVQHVGLESKKCVTLAHLNCDTVGTDFVIKVLPNGYTIVASHQRENNYNVIRVMVWSNDFSLLVHLSELKNAEKVFQIEWVKSKFILVAFPTSLVHVPITMPPMNLALQLKQQALTDMYLKKPSEQQSPPINIIVRKANQLEAEWDKAIQATEKDTTTWQTKIAKKGLTDAAALSLVKSNLAMLKGFPHIVKSFVKQCLECDFWASLTFLVQNHVMNADLITEEILVTLYRNKKFDIIYHIVHVVEHLTELKIVAIVHMVLTQPFEHDNTLEKIKTSNTKADSLSIIDFLLGTVLGYNLHNDIALAKSLLIMSIDEVTQILQFLNIQLDLVPQEKELVDLENISFWTRALVTAHFHTILANQQSSNAISLLLQIRQKIATLVKHMREVSLLAAKVKTVLNTPVQAMPKHKDEIKMGNYSVSIMEL